MGSNMVKNIDRQVISYMKRRPLKYEYYRVMVNPGFTFTKLCNTYILLLLWNYLLD